MICQNCGGRKRQKTREYKVFNLTGTKPFLVHILTLCDSCAFPLVLAQAKAEDKP